MSKEEWRMMDNLAREFVAALEIAGNCAYNMAKEKGFHDKPPSIDRQLLRIHGEVSEWGEAMRDGNPMSGKIPAFTHAEEEAADTVIRIMDACKCYGWRLGEAIIAKMKYNEGRPHLHGRVTG